MVNDITEALDFIWDEAFVVCKPCHKDLTITKET